MSQPVYAHPVDPSTYDAADPFWSSPGAIRHHLGSDWKVPIMTTVRAVTNGVVVYRGSTTVLGNVIAVLGDDGVYSAFCHLSGFIATVGQRVALGDPVAYSGNTGTASLGPHLHVAMGTTAGAIFGEEPLVDPWERIQSLLAAQPLPPIIPAPQKQESDMIHVDRLVNAAGNEFLGRTRITNDATGKFTDLDEAKDKVTLGQIDWFLKQGTVSEAGHILVQSVLTKIGSSSAVIDQAALDAAVDKALADNQFPTAAQIAKTVNDDAAKRLAQ